MHPTPWHFWPIVTPAFLWHLVGCLDYSAAQYEWQPWMKMVSQRQESYIDTMPDWTIAIWAISVWGGLLGALLLGFRARFAPLALFVSLVAMVILTGWTIGWATPTLIAIAGDTALVVLLGSCLFALLLWLYARAMNKAGVIGSDRRRR